MWLTLYVLNNCFNDGAKRHLGLKYKNKWYAITHSNNNVGCLIPKKFLRMAEKSERDEFLKRLNNSAPNQLKKTSMAIHKYVLDNYDVFKLDNLRNKKKRLKNENKEE